MELQLSPVAKSWPGEVSVLQGEGETRKPKGECSSGEMQGDEWCAQSKVQRLFLQATWLAFSSLGAEWHLQYMIFGCSGCQCWDCHIETKVRPS